MPWTQDNRTGFTLLLVEKFRYGEWMHQRRHHDNPCSTALGTVVRRPNAIFPIVVSSVLGLVLFSLTGCRGSAPIHTWRAPRLADVGTNGVVLLGIEGPVETTKPLIESLFAIQNVSNQPASVRRLVAATPQLIAPSTLQSSSPIRLVSTFEESPSDVAVAAAARQQGIPFLLSGQVLSSTGRSAESEELTISWRLTRLDGNGDSSGMPIHVNQKIIEQRYPELLQLTDPQERLRQAAILETCGLLSATVDRETVELSRSRWLPSPRNRQAMELAEAGNWPAAEKVWMSILERQPRTATIWINAAIAAAARQDFETAKTRVTEAIRLSVVSPSVTRDAQKTLVWIEMRQRDYHAAFGLSEPVNGWRISR